MSRRGPEPGWLFVGAVTGLLISIALLGVVGAWVVLAALP